MITLGLNGTKCILKLERILSLVGACGIYNVSLQANSWKTILGNRDRLSLKIITSLDMITPADSQIKQSYEWLDSMVFTVIPKSHDFYTRQVGYHFSYGVQVPYWFVKDLLE
jgi:hypothetical protein